MGFKLCCFYSHSDIHSYLTATNLSFSDIHVHPFNQGENATTVICDPSTLAKGEQDSLGFNCTRGPFVATEIKEASSGSSSASLRVMHGSCLSLLLLAVFATKVDFFSDLV
jgi:hypothetical protein